MHYSDEHRHVLAFCASKANEILWDRCGRTFDPEELMDEGWWRCLRRCEPGNLKPAIKNTIREIVKYAVRFYLGGQRQEVDCGRLKIKDENRSDERVMETEEYRRQQRKARQALARLDSRARKIITMHVLRGMPFARVGDRVHLSRTGTMDACGRALAQAKQFCLKGEL